MNQKFEYITVVATLLAANATGEAEVKLPDGKCVAIGAVIKGNTDDEIINLSLLEGTQTVLKPADVSFSTRSNGGSYRESLRPVDLDGGRLITVSLAALTASRPTNIKVQVLFMVEKTETSTSC